MFQTLQTFKDLYLRMVTSEVYNILKDVDDIKLEEKNNCKEDIDSKLLTEESIFVIIEDYVIIVCDLETELQLKEKHLQELERVAFILNTNGIEFRNSIINNQSEYTEKLNKMFKNS